MDNGILSHNTTTSNGTLRLELGKTFISQGQYMVKIIAEHRRLNDDNTITESWEGDNKLEYQTNGRSVSNQDDHSNDLLLMVGDDANPEQIKSAFDHVKQAEAILNPLNYEVVVRPESRDKAEPAEARELEST